MFIVDHGFSSAKYLYKTLFGKIRSSYRISHRAGDLLYKGNNYEIGDEALLRTGSLYIKTVEELIETYPMFVACCAKAAGISYDTDLVVGLPYDFWKEEQDKSFQEKENEINKLQDSLKSITLDNSDYRFDNVSVLPQGLGCIKTFLNQNTVTSGNLLMIDIGFNTVIFTLYSVERKKILYGKTFYKRGVYDMTVNILAPEIAKIFPGKTFTPAEINYIIETRKLQKGFENIDITRQIQAATTEYTKSLLKMIKDDLKEGFGAYNFSTVVFAGGGARLISEVTDTSGIDVKILANPEYANCYGFALATRQ